MLGNTHANGNKNKPKSEEHKNRISAALKGKSKSIEQRKKQAIAMTGRKQSAELIEKRSKAVTGNKWWKKDGRSIKSRSCPGEGWLPGRIYARIAK